MHITITIKYCHITMSIHVQKSHQSCFHHFLKKKHITTATKTRQPNSVVLFQTHLPPGRLHPRCLQFVSSMAITSPEKNPSTKNDAKKCPFAEGWWKINKKQLDIFQRKQLECVIHSCWHSNFVPHKFFDMFFCVFLGSSYGACKLISSGGSFHMSQISIESAPVDDCKWHIVFSGQKTRRMAWIREYMPIVAARDNISRLTREIKIALARKMPISYFCCTARIESMTNFGLISPLKG